MRSGNAPVHELMRALTALSRPVCVKPRAEGPQRFTATALPTGDTDTLVVRQKVLRLVILRQKAYITRACICSVRVSTSLRTGRDLPGASM
jgi:hypothetical protein